MVFSIVATPFKMVQIYQFAIENSVSMQEAYAAINNLYGGKKPFFVFRREYILPVIIANEKDFAKTISMYHGAFGDEVAYAQRACKVDSDDMVFFINCILRHKWDKNRFEAIGVSSPYAIVNLDKNLLNAEISQVKVAVKEIFDEMAVVKRVEYEHCNIDDYIAMLKKEQQNSMHELFVFQDGLLQKVELSRESAQV